MNNQKDLTEFPRLTGAQILQLIQANNRGENPPCFVCGEVVADQTFTLGTGSEEERVVVNAPCGHRMTYNANVARQKAAEARQITVQAAATEATESAAEDSELESLRREVAAARKFAAEMREFCSPQDVGVDWADRLIEAMDRAKEESR